MTKRFGFTLAEVLITLGIIGVVAAMTIPTLISNTNGAQFKTAYKKALSTLNQAVLMNIAMDDTDFSGLKEDAAGSTPAGSMSELLNARVQIGSELTDTYFSAATLGEGVTSLKLGNTEEDCTGVDTPVTGCTADGTYDASKTYSATTAKIWSLADGTSFGYLLTAKDCTAAAPCYGFIDVNGTAGPNKETTSSASADIQDIFPVIFHGQTLEPATNAAREVLFGK